MNSASPIPLAVGEREASRLIGVSGRTVFNWRSTGIGPPFKRVGSRILYPVAALNDWLNGTDANLNTKAIGGGQ